MAKPKPSLVVEIQQSTGLRLNDAAWTALEKLLADVGVILASEYHGIDRAGLARRTEAAQEGLFRAFNRSLDTAHQIQSARSEFIAGAACMLAQAASIDAAARDAVAAGKPAPNSTFADGRFGQPPEGAA